MCQVRHRDIPALRALSAHLDALKVGGAVGMRGPVGEFDYHGNGKFLKEHEECNDQDIAGLRRAHRG
jgi:hypothetical protein